MKSIIFLLCLTFRLVFLTADVGMLSELPYTALLAQKKKLEEGSFGEDGPLALAMVQNYEGSDKEMYFKGLHKTPHQKTFYEDDYDDEKGHVYKKKEDHKFYDILNTSVMALSYLAFGGYLLCMIASALRQKRRFMMGYPVAANFNNQFANVLQQYVTQRPIRPFNRFPAITVHHGGKKRRKRRSSQ